MNTHAILGLVLGGALGCAAAANPGPDPIEGNWFGTADQPGDAAGIGYEFKRDEKGEIRAFATNTTIQFSGRPAGPVRAEGDGRYTLTDSGLVLTLRDGRLRGELSVLKFPFQLSRVDSLPAPAVMPDYAPGPEPSWRAPLGAPIYATPAVRDDEVYVGTTGGLMHAVDLANGRFKWAFAAGRPIHGEALVDRAHVYFVCDNGWLFKLDRDSGKEVWRYDIGDERVSRTLLHFLSFENDHSAPAPLLADDVVYVGSGDGGFHAVDAATDKRVWRFQASGKIRKTAALDGTRVIFGTIGSNDGYAQNQGKLYALDRASGTLLWTRDMHGAVTSSPVIVDGKLIVGTRGSLLSALDPENGNSLWQKYFWGSWVESSPVPAGDLFYLGSADLRSVRAYQARDGSYRWSTYLFGWMWDRVAVASDTIYAATGATDLPGKPYQASLFAIERDTGKVRWRRAVPELPGILFTGFASAPVIAGSRLVVAGLDGTLYAFPVE